MTGEYSFLKEVARLLPLCETPKEKKELMSDLEVRNAKNFRTVYTTPSLAEGLIERTIPDKPNSSKQQYRLTEKGQRWLRTQSIKAGPRRDRHAYMRSIRRSLIFANACWRWDFQVPMLARMVSKRLAGYRAIGYDVQQDG